MIPPPEPRHIEAFRETIRARLGLIFDDDRLSLLADVLRQRRIFTGAGHYEGYLARLESNDLPTELGALADLLTVNETFFFRNADSFRALSEGVLEACIYRSQPTRTLRILSAGCSSGEEPYSIAIALREALPDISSWSIEILGIDASPAMLQKARRARYSQWSLRATPAAKRQAWFRPEGTDWNLLPEVREMVTFAEKNLLADDNDLWRGEHYDLIFCRNVIMYLEPDAMRRVVDRIAASLVPGGWLFVGHAETLRGLSQRFHLCHTHDTFYYQKVGDPKPGVRTTTSGTRPDSPPHAPASDHWLESIRQSTARVDHLTFDTHEPQPSNNTTIFPLITHTDAAGPQSLESILDHMRHERFGDALDELSKLPGDAENNLDVLLLKAVIQTNRGRFDEADALSTRLLELDDLNAGAHYLKALAREHSGDDVGANAEGETAAHLDPTFAMPHLHLGLIAARNGRAAAARDSLARALSLLTAETDTRVLLFGGGFSRDALLTFCKGELAKVGP